MASPRSCGVSIIYKIIRNELWMLNSTHMNLKYILITCLLTLTSPKYQFKIEDGDIPVETPWKLIIRWSVLNLYHGIWYPPPKKKKTLAQEALQFHAVESEPSPPPAHFPQAPAESRFLCASTHMVKLHDTYIRYCCLPNKRYPNSSTLNLPLFGCHLLTQTRWPTELPRSLATGLEKDGTHLWGPLRHGFLQRSTTIKRAIARQQHHKQQDVGQSF